MANALAPRPNGNGTTLAQRLAPDEWTREYLDVLKAIYGKGCSDAEFAHAIQVSKVTKLRIDTHELWVYKRNPNEPVTITISIDGFRAIAHESGTYAGDEGPLYCGKDGQYVETWLDDKPPVAAKFTVWRTDFTRPFTAVILLSEFRNNSPFWRDRPVHQSGIRAATHAFRKAYRQEIAERQARAQEVGIHLALEPETAPPPAFEDAEFGQAVARDEIEVVDELEPTTEAPMQEAVADAQWGQAPTVEQLRAEFDDVSKEAVPLGVAHKVPAKTAGVTELADAITSLRERVEAAKAKGGK